MRRNKIMVGGGLKRKYIVSGKVKGFRYDGVRYLRGEVVEIDHEKYPDYKIPPHVLTPYEEEITRPKRKMVVEVLPDMVTGANPSVIEKAKLSPIEEFDAPPKEEVTRKSRVRRDEK